jgi:hypothetical protein
MAPRTFFVIVLKITGILLLKDFLLILPQLIGDAYAAFSGVATEDVMWQLLPTVFILSVLAWIIRLCFYRTDYIIDKFSLDQHFTQELFEINIHRSSVIQISAILLGCWMIVDAVPVLANDLFYYVLQKRSGIPDNSNTIQLLVHSVQILVGLALVSNSRLVLNIIERQRRV